MKTAKLSAVTPILLVLALSSFASAARAEICSLDVNPAATLLLPYFEVDLDGGANTVFSVSNAGSFPALARVILWSDLSVPVLSFNVYLTGYDMQTIDLRQLLVSGILPRTASDGQDPLDTISPQGHLSHDINFASCNGQLPPPNLPLAFIDHLRRSLTGLSSPILGGRCAGRNLGDNVARGYITLDAVRNCQLRFPGDTDYFLPGGTGDATNDNVLWGDYSWLSADGRQVSGTLVGIQADAQDPRTSTNGRYTFYGRYVNWSAIDNREPLPTTFGVRYRLEQTDLVVWRDSKVATGPFVCPATGGRPAYYPLGQEDLVIFDEQENAEEPEVESVSPASKEALTPFAAETQRVPATALQGSFNGGWFFLNLNTTVTPAGANPPQDPAAAQAWVSAMTFDPSGRFSGGYDAMRYDTACNPWHLEPPF